MYTFVSGGPTRVYLRVIVMIINLMVTITVINDIKFMDAKIG
jgi:hypothetical protein